MFALLERNSVSFLLWHWKNKSLGPMLAAAASFLTSPFDDEEPILQQYAASLSGTAPQELKALERLCRSLNLYVNLNDTEGQVQACDALVEMCHTTANGGLFLSRTVLDQGTLPSLVVILHGAKSEPCRAGAALLAEICGRNAELRKAVVRSGALRPLVALLRQSDEPRLLREGARVLAALASEPAAVGALLRESAPRALKHLCRSRAVQAHALAVRALGRLARSDATLLASAGLPRVFCSVASGSVLDARCEAACEMRLLLQLPSRRAAMLDAGAVRVLLRCCDVLNESLKLASLHALAILLSGASVPLDLLPSAAPKQLEMEAYAAEAARDLACHHLGEHAGTHVLVSLCDDPKLPVACRALQVIEFLARDPPNHPALEQAKIVPTLVALAKGGTLRAPPGDGEEQLTWRDGDDPNMSLTASASAYGGLKRAPSSPSRTTSRFAVGGADGGRNVLENVARDLSREVRETTGKISKAFSRLTDDRRQGGPGEVAAALTLGQPIDDEERLGVATDGTVVPHTASSDHKDSRLYLEAGAAASSEPPPLPPGARRMLVTRALANLLASSSAQIALVAAGGVPALLRMVEADQLPSERGGGGRWGLRGSSAGGPGGGVSRAGVAEVRREVVRALARLCSSPLHAPTLYRDGCLPVILALLETAHKDNDERSLRHAACALGAFTALPDVQLEISRRRAVPAIVRLARSRDADTQRHAARAIGHLAGNAQCQKEIGAAGGLRPLIKCGYSRSAELQQLVVKAVANLALEPDVNRMLEQEGGHQLLLTLIRSKTPEVVHWAHVAQGNLEAASALGPLIKHCPADNIVEPVDMMTMSALVAHLRSTALSTSAAVRRLTTAAIANLLVSGHNQRLLLECNGVKPLVALAQEALEPELQGQCMRAIANLAVTPEYRANLLQARTLPLLVSTLKGAQMQQGGSHTFVVLTHTARALGNLCAGGDVAPAMQQKAAVEGAIPVLLPLLTRAREYLSDIQRANMPDRLSGVDDLVREVVRALAKLAQLKSNQRPIVESDAIHMVVRMLSPDADRDGAVSIGVKQECLELLGHLAEVPECLRVLVSDGALQSLISLLHLPDENVETAAAELLAKLAQVGEYQQQISSETIPLLIELLKASASATQLAGLHALNELLFENRQNQLVALRAGAVPPCVQLARLEDPTLNAAAATLLCQMVLAEAADRGQTAARGGEDERGLLRQQSVRLGVDLRLNMLAAMAMSANAEAHSVAAMGLATMTNAPDANVPEIAKVALQSLVKLGRASGKDTQCAALDALSVLAEYPDVQVDLVRVGGLRMLLERAGTPGSSNNDIRSLALTTLQHLASNGANMAALQSGDIRNRLRGLAQALNNEPVVVRAVDAIERSIGTISSLLELQGKSRGLRKGDVASMSQCVQVAGPEASISREVGHTCAAIGAQRGNVELFLSEGGLELLNSLAHARSTAVQLEAAQAIATFCRAREAHQALAKQGGLQSLVHLAKSHNAELQIHVATAFYVLSEQQAPKTWLVQSGCVPVLFGFIRNGDAEVKYLAAKALLYMK